MKTKAVVDRFEGDKAVLLVGKSRIIVAKDVLPNGTKEGDWLKIEVEDDRILNAILDIDSTIVVKNKIAVKLSNLRSGDHRK